jgi:hypothetical protein
MFLSRARQRFRSHVMEFTLFDLDHEEHAAAHEGRYDVVLIANALHAAKDLRISLERVRRVLQPGGILVLVETTAAQAWHDVSTGLIEGWQHFSDDARSGGSPLLAVEKWANELEHAGFEHFFAAPDSSLPTDKLGLHVLLAHKPVDDQESSENAAFHSATLRQTATAVADLHRDEALQQQSEEGDPAADGSRGAAKLREDLASSPAAERIALVTAKTAVAVAHVLGSGEAPHKTDRLMDIGLDSLMAIELRNRLQIVFDVEELPSTLIFDYPTSEAIAALLLIRMGYDENGQHVGSLQDRRTGDERETGFATMTVHSDDELDAMSDNEIAELLRLQLGQ